MRRLRTTPIRRTTASTRAAARTPGASRRMTRRIIPRVPALTMGAPLGILAATLVLGIEPAILPWDSEDHERRALLRRPTRQLPLGGPFPAGAPDAEETGSGGGPVQGGSRADRGSAAPAACPARAEPHL